MTIWILAALGGLLLVVGGYIATRYYEARYDRTFMTHDDRGFKRALKGKTVLWDWEESVVKGPTAPSVGFVALDPATGGRRNVPLLDQRTGSLNLRPQYCAPLPFNAITADAHKIVVDARVQFSLNRDLLKHVYEIQDFSFALETRIQSAFRAEIGKRADEDLRASLNAVERAVIDHLRRDEQEGDEKGEAGMALGVVFHTASISYSQPDEFGGGAGAVTVMTPGPDGQPVAQVQARGRGQSVLALRPQQLDQIADVFKNRDPAATRALLALLEMQTRQNIADALASSGHLVVLTAQELGLFGASAQRDALRAQGEAPGAHIPNGEARPDRHA